MDIKRYKSWGEPEDEDVALGAVVEVLGHVDGHVEAVLGPSAGLLRAGHRRPGTVVHALINHRTVVSVDMKQRSINVDTLRHTNALMAAKICVPATNRVPGEDSCEGCR